MLLVPCQSKTQQLEFWSKFGITIALLLYLCKSLYVGPINYYGGIQPAVSEFAKTQ